MKSKIDSAAKDLIKFPSAIKKLQEENLEKKENEKKVFYIK